MQFEGITIKDAKTEGAVVQIIKNWATANPADLVLFQKQVEILKREKHRESAITDGGNLLHKAEVPARLFWQMQFYFGKEWFQDAKLRNTFLRNFPIGLLNRTSESIK